MEMMAPGLGARAVRVVGVRRDRFVEAEGARSLAAARFALPRLCQVLCRARCGDCAADARRRVGTRASATFRQINWQASLMQALAITRGGAT